MYRGKGPGGDSSSLSTDSFPLASTEDGNGVNAHQGLFIQVPVPEATQEAPTSWFFRKAEELAGSAPSDFPGGKDPGDLKWSDARRYALMRDNRACTMRSCRHEEDLTVHHILPRLWGGTHHPGNLVTLCTRCHRTLCDSCTRSLTCRVPPTYYPP